MRGRVYLGEGDKVRVNFSVFSLVRRGFWKILIFFCGDFKDGD